MGRFENDSIFWIEVEKIVPNPYQPRRDFDEEGLRDLAESIRQYGVLQPLTVTRNEKEKESGGIEVEYELIAGERRHRAAEKAGLSQVPAIIRSGEETSKMKLELAIIENLQREDLNPVERAQAFERLSEEFDFTHSKIAEKIGKSREYVSNSIRLLTLPEEMQNALMADKITEGHAKPLMMLRDQPEEQETLFKEIIYKGLTVRESEEIARRIAQDKVRNKETAPDPETVQAEEELSESLGTRVRIKRKEEGGKLIIDFFSEEDLENLLEIIKNAQPGEAEDMMEQYIQKKKQEANETNEEESGPDSVAEVQEVLQQEAKEDQKDNQPDEDASDEPEGEEQTQENEETGDNEDTAESKNKEGDVGSAAASGVASAAEIIAQAEESTDDQLDKQAQKEETSNTVDSKSPAELKEEMASIDEEETKSIVENSTKDNKQKSTDTNENTSTDEQTGDVENAGKQSSDDKQMNSFDQLDEEKREQIGDLISDHFGDEVNEQVMREIENATDPDDTQNSVSKQDNQNFKEAGADENVSKAAEEGEKTDDATEDDDLYSVSNFSV